MMYYELQVYMQHKVGWGEATATSVIINHAWAIFTLP